MSMQPKNGEITTQNSNGKLPDVCENHKKSCFKKTRIKQTFLRLEEEKYSMRKKFEITSLMDHP